MVVTPYGHVLYTTMLQIAGRFVSAILRNRGGYGKPTAHAHVIMFDALPVGRTACREDNGVLEDVCSRRKCSKARPNVSR